MHGAVVGWHGPRRAAWHEPWTHGILGRTAHARDQHAEPSCGTRLDRGPGLGSTAALGVCGHLEWVRCLMGYSLPCTSPDVADQQPRSHTCVCIAPHSPACLDGSHVCRRIARSRHRRRSRDFLLARVWRACPEHHARVMCRRGAK